VVIFGGVGVQISQAKALKSFGVHLLPSWIRERRLHRTHFLLPHRDRLGRGHDG
jgi:hypothetical protein